MIIQDWGRSRQYTHRSAIAEAVWRDDSQSQIHQHGDLVAPSHRDVWEAMDLEIDSALDYLDMTTLTGQVQLTRKIVARYLPD